MIDIESAIQKVTKSKIFTDCVHKEITQVLGYYLAQDVISPMNMPPFSQSAMDGYAICGELETYCLVGEIKAGDTHTFKLKNGEAYRIFTGAMIPENTTSIAKQEIVIKHKDKIALTEKVKIGMSIRLESEELTKGDVVLKKGTKINPAAIGLLTGLGLQEIEVYEKPKITVIVTGSELTKAGLPLEKGKIYESNSNTIQSALLENGFESNVKWVKDDYQSTFNLINSAIKNNNVVIMTGGISVGDYDFVGKALNEIGVNQKFYKVNQKPGKPIYYGEKNNTKVFALPGNPAAALTCFYVYVLTALKVMIGSQNPQLTQTKAVINHSHLKKGDRAHLLKAQVNQNTVTVHTGQSSAMLSSFVDANCLIHLKSDVNQVNQGETVNVLMLPK